MRGACRADFRNGCRALTLDWCNYFLCNDSTRHHQSCNTYHARRPSSAQLTFRSARETSCKQIEAMPQALPHPASSPRGQYDTRGEDEHRSAPQRLLEDRRVSTEALHIQKEIVRLKKKAAFQPEPSPNQSEVAPPKEPTNMPASDCNTPPDLTSDSPPRPAGDGSLKAPRQYIKRRHERFRTYILKSTRAAYFNKGSKAPRAGASLPVSGGALPLISTLSRTTFSVIRSTGGRGCVLHGDQQPRRHLRRRRRSAHGRGGRGRWRARRRQRRRVRVGAA